MNVKTIVIIRAEGPTRECGIEHKVTSFEAASTVLAAMARSAPQGGGYDKTDFVVTFEDGEKYEGRADLTREHTSGYDLRKHMLDFCEFYAGRRCPPHMTKERYETFLASEGSPQAADFATFIDKYLAQ